MIFDLSSRMHMYYIHYTLASIRVYYSEVIQSVQSTKRLCSVGGVELRDFMERSTALELLEDPGGDRSCDPPSPPPVFGKIRLFHYKTLTSSNVQQSINVTGSQFKKPAKK